MCQESEDCVLMRNVFVMARGDIQDSNFKYFSNVDISAISKKVMWRKSKLFPIISSFVLRQVTSQETEQFDQIFKAVNFATSVLSGLFEPLPLV